MMLRFLEYLTFLENSTISQELKKNKDEEVRSVHKSILEFLSNKIPDEKYRKLVADYMTYFRHQISEQAFWEEFGAIVVAKTHNNLFRQSLASPTFTLNDLKSENDRYHHQMTIGKSKNNKGPEGLAVVDVAHVLSQCDAQKHVEDYVAADYNPAIWIGWKWVSLGKKYCSEEAAAAGHCGNIGGSPGENIFSLRDPKDRIHATFIVKNGVLGEAKGINNEKPAKEYLPAIAALFLAGYITEYEGGGYAPENNFRPGDWTTGVQDLVFRHRPKHPKTPENFFDLDKINSLDEQEIFNLSVHEKVNLILGMFAFKNSVHQGHLPQLLSEIRNQIGIKTKMTIYNDSATNQISEPEVIQALSEYARDIVEELPKIQSYTSLSWFSQCLLAQMNFRLATLVVKKMSEIQKITESDTDQYLYFTYENSDVSTSANEFTDLLKNLIVSDRMTIGPQSVEYLSRVFRNEEEYTEYLEKHPELIRINKIPVSQLILLIKRGVVKIDKQNIQEIKSRIAHDDEFLSLCKEGAFDLNELNPYQLNALFPGFSLDRVLSSKLYDLDKQEFDVVLSYIPVDRILDNYWNPSSIFEKLKKSIYDQDYIPNWRVLKSLFNNDEIENLLKAHIISPKGMWQKLADSGFDLIDILQNLKQGDRPYHFEPGDFIPFMKALKISNSKGVDVQKLNELLNQNLISIKDAGEYLPTRERIVYDVKHNDISDIMLALHKKGIPVAATRVGYIEVLMYSGSYNVETIRSSRHIGYENRDVFGRFFLKQLSYVLCQTIEGLGKQLSTFQPPGIEYKDPRIGPPAAKNLISTH